MSSKITPELLERAAYVYIRQSSQDQVRNRQESQRRQYALQDHARQLGWTKVVVIDEDQGRSGSGTARSGFDRLIAAVCEGRVGAVLALEVSRLARNGREWHTLMEFCGIVGTLVIDEHGVYDPRSTNDRLLLAHLIQRIAGIRKLQLYKLLNPRIDLVSRPARPPDRREFRYVRTVWPEKPPAVQLPRH